MWICSELFCPIEVVLQNDTEVASSVLPLLEFVLCSCEDPYCKVSPGIKQNTSVAHDGTLFGMFALAFL